ncbi:MAG TPA: PA0069 family radical SAM protein [Phycisphaerae bacterium]|nr:PA0069 family radical SAM protein [Phycisphaerae bacterium]
MALKLVANPPNPYESQYREFLGPPPPVKVEIYEEHAKSLVTENDSPDIPFRWSVNPYRGCQHACAYCYARPYHEYLGMGAGTDFDTKLVAKINAAELLRKEVARPKLRGQPICFSGVTDCYQPIEVTYKLTQECLRVCLEMGNAVSIITKSFLVMRDAQLLSQLDRAVGATVYQSIPFADDKLARLIEPQAPPPSKRFEAMRRLTDAGVPVGVMVAPIIPGLNDQEIPEVLRRAAESGASSAGYVPLRLPGSVAAVFMERLKAVLPLRAQRVESRIREMRDGQLNDSRFGNRMRGDGEYWRSIQGLFRLSVERFGLNSRRREKEADGPAMPAPRAATGQATFDFA